jgi:hypothetical protein
MSYQRRFLTLNADLLEVFVRMVLVWLEDIELAEMGVKTITG